MLLKRSKSQRSSCACTWASTLSVLTFADAIALVRIGLLMTMRRQSLAMISY